MKNIRNYTVFFLCLSVAAISLAMAVKNWITYAPVIGWILAMFFIIAALISAIRNFQ